MRAASLLPATVLLVDGSRDGLLVRRALLEEQGLHVEIARTAEEGLKLMASCHFDVVVTAFRMTEMDGIELISRIRESHPRTRTVLLSSFAEPLGLNEQNTGADAVIAKNSNEAANLIRTVRRLSNKQAGRAPARKPAASQIQARPMARARA